MSDRKEGQRSSGRGQIPEVDRAHTPTTGATGMMAATVAAAAGTAGAAGKKKKTDDIFFRFFLSLCFWFALR